jgi:hypothetical protein
MSDNYQGKLLIPRMQRPPDRARLKITVAILVLTLILIGIAIEMAVWWGATN